jgi:hypothetical protein
MLLFPSKMVMEGMLLMFQLNKILRYMLIADDAQGGQTRPRRSPKLNPKYNPEVFDLSYVGVRKGSRKSIRIIKVACTRIYLDTFPTFWRQHSRDQIFNEV